MELDSIIAIPKLLSSPNIAELLTDGEVASIGEEVVRLYDIDKETRVDWEKKMEDALKLALQVAEKKSYPWPNASNVKFPLITVAALQYHSRAYPALLSGNQLVLCRTVGEDADGEKTKRATRVAEHMSYQLLEEDEGWEDQMDKVLITQPIIGCAFKKSYFDSTKNHNISENVFAKDLVVSYYTKTLESAPRISHVMYLSKNEIRERVVSGIFSDVSLYQSASPMQNALSLAKDKAQGITQPFNDPDTPAELIEQHCWIDFDNDGYQEPYVVTVHKESRQVLRIVARYLPNSVKRNAAGDVISISAENYFTKYPFIPSPDGGFYDLGFGALLGPLNESINTIINQLVDAGTLNNTGGGFLGRGVKFKGGNVGFTPGEWKPVDSTGDDLRKGIVPLVTPQPSNVLFQMLDLLINYGERVGGATDAMTGINPGQNTPAETSRSMVEQGSKVFNGIFKRTYRSLKDEFKKLYRLNQIYLDDENEFPSGLVTIEDYSGPSSDIRPAADPSMVSDSQRISQAMSLLQMASSSPGFDMYQVQKRVLDAWKVMDIEQVLPNPKGPNAIQQGPSEKIQIEQMKTELKKQEMQSTLQITIAELMQTAEVDKAKIIKMEAEAALALAEAKGVPLGHMVGLAQIQLAEAKAKREGLLQSVKILQQQMHHEDKIKETKQTKE